MEEFYLVSEVGPLVAKMKCWSMKEEVVDKEKIGDKEESAVKKEVSEKVEVTEDVTDKKVVSPKKNVHQVPMENLAIICEICGNKLGGNDELKIHHQEYHKCQQMYNENTN